MTARKPYPNIRTMRVVNRSAPSWSSVASDSTLTPRASLLPVQLLDLLVGHPFPAAVVHLGEAGINVDRSARGHDLGGLTGPDQRTRHDLPQLDAGEAPGERFRLRPALVRQLDVDLLAEVLLGLRPGRQPMPREDEREHDATPVSLLGRSAGAGDAGR